MQTQGIVECIFHPESKKRKLYYLTQKGKELIYVIAPLGRWSKKYLGSAVEFPQKYRRYAKSYISKLTTAVMTDLEEWEQSVGI